jgi:hypothetical protein
MAPRSSRNVVSDNVISQLVSDSRLHGKWVSSSTLEVALKPRCDFGDHLSLTSMMMKTVMTALEPDVDSVQQSSNSMCRVQHDSCAVPDGK